MLERKEGEGAAGEKKQRRGENLVPENSRVNQRESQSCLLLSEVQKQVTWIILNSKAARKLC